MDFNNISKKIMELAAKGYRGDELADELINWAKNDTSPRNFKVQDFFDVSDEEIASWYDMDSVKFNSFDDFTESVMEHHMNTAIGYVRKAMRQYRDEMIPVVDNWFSMTKPVIIRKDLGRETFLSDGTITFFTSICYFMAENHLDQFFWPIINTLRYIHTDRYKPAHDFVLQSLHAVLYAVCDGDFERVMDTIMDRRVHQDVRNSLGIMLTAYAMDGVFTKAKVQEMQKRWYNSVRRNGDDGRILAEWIALSGNHRLFHSQLTILLRDNVDIHFYGTVNPNKFVEMVCSSSTLEIQNYPKGLLMDDSILYGMMKSEIHAPEELRRKSIAVQAERVKKMTARYHA